MIEQVQAGCEDRRDLIKGSSSDPLGMSHPPVIVRMAGLAGNTLEPLSSPSCITHLETLWVLQAQLSTVRSQLVEILGESLARFAPDLRRFMLTVRRDCFNGRSIHKRRSEPAWAELRRISSGLADKILDLEIQVCDCKRAFDLLYEREAERERQYLLSLVRDERFLRGIALGSPLLAQKARALPQMPFKAYNRQERKLEQSLLRFATRAAAKLSPYSTLTSIALGKVRDEPEPRSFRFLSNAYAEASLVRVNRSVLDRYQHVLLLYPIIRGVCHVALNDTVREYEPGRYHFLQNGHWEVSPDRKGWQFVPSRFVKVGLSGSLFSFIRKFLTEGPVPYDVLLAELESDYRMDSNGHGEAVRRGLEGLISLGVLSLLSPWPTYETNLERRMLDTLQSLCHDPYLERVCNALVELIRVESIYPENPLPEHSVEHMKRALVGVLSAINPQAREEGDAGEKRNLRDGLFYEDVFISSNDQSLPDGEVFDISSRVVQEIMHSADLVFRFASLYNHRHDVLHTLAAFWAERWPLRHEVGLLELFHEFQSLWRNYVRFDYQERYFNLSSFNPLQLASVAALSRMREEVYTKVQEVMLESAIGKLLPQAEFTEFLESIPLRYRPHVGSSAFVQPADPAGNHWVLNRLFEGTGRYLSRYGAPMGESVRGRFITHLTARSAVDIEGERVEFLDLMFTHGSMTNLHGPQTFKVLNLPGECLHIASNRRVHLSDLRVGIDLPSETFRLMDGQGCRLLPVHMSSVNNLFLPPVVRFLSIFGPYETRQIVPRPKSELIDGIRMYKRLCCGSLVIFRKRWEMAALVIDKGSLSDADTFESVEEWRRRVGMPQQVFLYEQIHQAGEPVQAFKPQYIDFSSPSLVNLLLSILRKNTDGLIFEEALPSFANFPPDRSGEPRAFEVQVDSLALGRPSGGCSNIY